MTSSDSILTLISRLEQAAEGSRELDAEIWLALHDGKWPQGLRSEYHKQPVWVDDPHQVPEYTTSLDAALSLVAENHTVYLTRPNQTVGGCTCVTSYACVAPPGMGGSQYAKKRAHLTAFHKSLPIALTIASLKALFHTPSRSIVQ